MANSYYLGQTIRLSVNIQVTAVDTDPGALTFWIRPGVRGTKTEYIYGTDAALVKDSTGDYHVDWLVADEVEHFYGFRNPSTGAARGAVESRFLVRNSAYS